MRSGSSPHSWGWCQQRSCPLLSRCARMPSRRRFTSDINSSRLIPETSSSIAMLLTLRPPIHFLHQRHEGDRQNAVLVDLTLGVLLHDGELLNVACAAKIGRAPV